MWSFVRIQRKAPYTIDTKMCDSKFSIDVSKIYEFAFS